MTEVLRITRRHLPHWTMDDATYFVTFRLARGVLTEEERDLVFRRIKEGNRRYYELHGAVVMADHVHLILNPKSDLSLSRILKGLKGSTAREINRIRRSSGRIWQAESYDRIVRDEDELLEKLQYVVNNPQKQGLVDDPWTYPWLFVDGITSGKSGLPAM